MKNFDYLPWLQLIHKKNRLVISIIGVAFSVALMFLTTGLRDGLFEDSVTIHKTLQADLVLLVDDVESFWESRGKPFPLRLLYSIKSINGITSVSPFYLSVGGFKNPEKLTKKFIYVYSFNPQKPVFNLPEVNQQISIIQKNDFFLFDRFSRKEFGDIVSNFATAGTVTTQLSDKRIKIGGFFSIGGGVFSADGSLITSDLTYAKIFNQSLSKVHLGLINLEDNIDQSRIIAEISNKLPVGIKVITKEDFMAGEKAYWRQATPIGFIFNILGFVGLIFGAIIVYQIIFTQIYDYLFVYATFKAIGYRNLYLAWIVIQEGWLMSVMGYAPGLIIASGSYGWIKDATRLPMEMTVSRLLVVFVQTLVMCSFGSLIAIKNLREADPADLFN